MVLITQKEYAETKKVSLARVNHLLLTNKLRGAKLHGRNLVEDCEENDKLFLNPSHRRKIK